MSIHKNRFSDNFNYDSVWERVKFSTNIKNQTDLANIVGIRQSSVSDRKKSGIWPIEWAYKIGKEYNLCTEWILTGEGPKKISNVNKKYNFKLLYDIDCWLSEIVEIEPYRKDWFRASFEDNYPSFKEWMNKR